jgi:LuxR family maltose regulon positive regulatory protein
MNEALSLGLTLISAPPGFGKTTLVSEWAAGAERPIAWLSLDEADSDLTRFLVYAVSALQTLMPSLGEGVLRLLQSPEPPPTESVLGDLINEIAHVQGEFVLVLDDYLVDSGPVDAALTFLLDHPSSHAPGARYPGGSRSLARYRGRVNWPKLREAIFVSAG